MVITNSEWNYGDIEISSKDSKKKKYDGFKIGSYTKKMKFGTVYGPIISRRSGLSLGINPIDGGFACNWECNYCQYGESIYEKDKIRFNTPEEIRERLDDILPTLINELKKNKGQGLDSNLSLTICGPTEPTLSPYFDQIVDVAEEIKEKYSSEGIRLHSDLFTNCTNLNGENLEVIDNIYLKLDAGNEETFQRVNMPKNGTNLDDLIEKINKTNIKRKIIQTMLLDGIDGNINHDDVKDYVEKIKEIQPSEIQLYTMLYKAKDYDIKPVRKEKMIEIGELIEREIPETTVVVYDKPVKEGSDWIF